MRASYRTLALVSFTMLALPLAPPLGALAASEPTATEPTAPTGKIPPRPEQLAYGSLTFEVPKAESMRYQLPGGVVVYVAPDRSLPLINIVLNIRTGAFREPAAKPGLAAMTATLMRVGGTTTHTPQEFDEAADFLAAQVGSSAGDTSARASLNVLSSALQPGLDLLFDMLRNPRFDEERLAVEKGKSLEAMKQRNDDADDILRREWSWLVNGRDHFSSRRATAAELESISKSDLAEFHRRTWGPERMVIAVSGDVDPKAIVAELGRRLAGWKATESVPWPPQGPKHEMAPGLYRVEKDIPQGKVRLGHRSIQVTDWNDPEIAALEVMNDIFGNGDFTSRLMQRVRSNEGLAYGISSDFGFGVYWPGTFTIGYESKNPTVAYAMKLALEELDRLKRDPVTAEELRISKATFIETFPRSFETAAAVAGTFASDELVGRPHSYWYGYRARIDAVTPEQVLAVAKKYLAPEKLVGLVVGKWAEIAPGDPEGRAKMEQLFGGKASELPLRDPLTLEPLPSGARDSGTAH